MTADFSFSILINCKRKRTEIFYNFSLWVIWASELFMMNLATLLNIEKSCFSCISFILFYSASLVGYWIQNAGYICVFLRVQCIRKIVSFLKYIFLYIFPWRLLLWYSFLEVKRIYYTYFRGFEVLLNLDIVFRLEMSCIRRHTEKYISLRYCNSFFFRNRFCVLLNGDGWNSNFS